MVPGFALATLAIVVGSLIDKAPEAPVTQRFDAVAREIASTDR
jgi:hypothetical protein